MDTPYQKRYIAHQARKREQITQSIGETAPAPWSSIAPQVFEALDRRRSQRVFTALPVEERDIEKVLEAGTKAPNSCNRHGMLVMVIRDRAEKELLGGLLVGGVGWMHRADTVFLFLADPLAYASPNEKAFMHYCDVGFMATNMWLAAEALGLGACYINPNITHKDVFKEHFAHELIFCGALCIGRYDRRAMPAERITTGQIRL